MSLYIEELPCFDEIPNLAYLHFFPDFEQFQLFS